MPFVHGTVVGGSVSGNDLIEEVLRMLLGGQREEINKLAQSVEPRATTLRFEHELGSIRQGAHVDIGLETYRVWSVDGPGKAATVEPGMSGTLSTDHEAGELVYVNPRLPRHAVFGAINDEITALSSPANGLYRIKSVELTYQANSLTYDLAGVTDLLDIYEVRQSVPGPGNHWIRLDGWRYGRASNRTVFPSGHALYLPMGTPGQTVRVLYRAPFSRMPAPDNDVETAAGVPPEMQDIIPLGALLRLGALREIKRNFTEAQGDSRRAEEVPAGAVTSSFRYVQAARQERINAEAARLIQMYPPRR